MRSVTITVEFVADMAFLLVSIILTAYSVRVIRFMNRIRYHPTIIKYVTVVGLVASVAAVLEMTADFTSNQILGFYHAIGMFLMSAILLLAVRNQLMLLKRWAKQPEIRRRRAA